MLAPALKALDLLKALGEGLEDHTNELIIVGDKFDPEVLNVGHSLAVFRHDLLGFLVGIVCCVVVVFTFNNLLDLKMGQEVEVLWLRLAARGRQVVVERLILDLVGREEDAVVEDDLGVE